jgi:DeoR family glycerol-3-phosphate regulon repressor
MQILRLVSQTRFVSVDAIAAAMNVSEITVRRDLAQLEKEGAVKRTHGGAVPAGRTDDSPSEIFEPAFEARRRQNQLGKEQIARAAGGLIRRGETVALDVGTTALAFAEEIAGRDDLKVVTNSLRAARLLADGAVEVYVPGGRVRRHEHAVTGPIAAAALESYWFDTAIIGVAGLTATALYDYSPDDSEIKRVFMRRSRRILVLADKSKLGRRALVEVAPLTEGMTIVTDAPVEAAFADALALRQVEIITAVVRAK